MTVGRSKTVRAWENVVVGNSMVPKEKLVNADIYSYLFPMLNSRTPVPLHSRTYNHTITSAPRRFGCKMHVLYSLPMNPGVPVRFRLSLYLPKSYFVPYCKTAFPPRFLPRAPHAYTCTRKALVNVIVISHLRNGVLTSTYLAVG